METPATIQRLSAWWARVRQSPEVRAAMKAYRAQYPACEYCGSKRRLAVHHVLPVRVRPDLAATRWNFMTLCFRCHLSIAHLNNFAKRYVANLRDIISDKQEGRP